MLVIKNNETTWESPTCRMTMMVEKGNKVQHLNIDEVCYNQRTALQALVGSRSASMRCAAS